jgi:hypothetical protein
MALLTVQNILGSITPTYAAVAASDTFAAALGSDYILHVKNAGGSPDVCKVDDPNSVDPGLATAWDPDLSVSVTNGQERIIRISTVRHKSQSTGLVTITHSFTTSVTCAVFVLP